MFFLEAYGLESKPYLMTGRQKAVGFFLYESCKYS